MPYDVLQREIAFYLLAGAQTSIHSLVHVFHEIHSWLKENPEREDDIKNDPIFVQKCFLESTRLHPSSPVALRKPVCPVQLTGNKTDVELYKSLTKDGLNLPEDKFNKLLLDLEILGLIKVAWFTKDERRIEVAVIEKEEDPIEKQNKEVMEKDYEASFPGVDK